MKSNLKKLKYAVVLQLLAIVSIVTVGFSTWGYGTITGVTVDIGTNVSDVINIYDYMTFSSMSMFDYCKYGVVNDETIVYSGDVSVSFSIAVKEGICTKLGNLTSLSLSTSLNCSFNLVSSSYLGSSSPSIGYAISTSSYPTATSLSSTGATNDTTHSVTSTIVYSDDNLSTITRLYYYLSYHFDFSSVSSTFETSIYNYLINTNYSLSLQVKVNV